MIYVNHVKIDIIAIDKFITMEKTFKIDMISL